MKIEEEFFADDGEADEADSSVRGASKPSGRGVRLRGILISIPIAAVVVAACLLKPARRGFGTHEDMSLPSCSFLVRTGYPCPTCGMTTSFSSMAHGQIWRAFLAQPFGAVLFAGIVTAGIFAMAEFISGRSVLHILHPGVWMVWVLVFGLLAGWAGKIIIGLCDGTLPIK